MDLLKYCIKQIGLRWISQANTMLVMNAVSSVIYRTATLADAQALLDANAQIFRKNRDFDPNYIIGWEQQSGAVKFFEAVCTRMNGICILAEYDGEMVGYASVIIHPELVWKRATAEIDNVGVLAEYRHHGVGGELLSRCERWSLENGFQRVWINPYAANTDAVELYTDHGYQTLELIMNKELVVS